MRIGTERKHADGRPARRGGAVGQALALVRRYPLIIVALLVAAALVGGSLYLARLKQADGDVARDFDPTSVLPPAVTQPPATTVYDAASIKQYDGQNGHRCYVAVKGTVYEIKDNPYWQQGRHTPSNGQGYCGADMSEVIKQSPHGESVLQSLPKVGVYKQ